MNFIGIDLGGTNIAAALVHEDGTFEHKVSIPTRTTDGTEAVLSGLDKVVELVLEESGLSASDIRSIGIGCPGMMNVETGEVLFSANLPLANVNITTGLKAKYGVPVYINNDANCAALGEVTGGAAKGTQEAIFVTLGTGVGGGIVTGGKIYSGHNGCAGEIGHIVIQMGGRQCGCGRKGCWEAYASATGLIVTTKEHMEGDKSSKMWEIVDGDLTKVNGRTAFDAMRAGDETAKKVVDIYIRHLAAGVIDLINIFEPEVIAIGGGISNEGETLLAPLREIVNAETYSGKSDQVSQVRITKASLGNDAGIVGAGMLGR